LQNEVNCSCSTRATAWRVSKNGLHMSKNKKALSV
jgi:hypothetical protein